MAKIEVDGVNVWYDVQGEGEPLVLVGGNSLVHRQWDFILPYLKTHFTVILFDQRGAGFSDRTTKGLTVEQWVDDLKHVLDTIGVKEAHLFGTSSGSFIVLRFAAKYPERTGSIVHYGMYKMTDQAGSIYRIGMKIVEELGTGRTGSYFLVRLFGIPQAYEEWETGAFEANLSRDTWKPMHEAIFIDLTDDLKNIRAPQLLLLGDTGPLSKESGYGAGWKDVKQIRSDAEVAIIPDASGTYCVIEKPKKVADKVIDFVGRYGIS